MQAMATSEGNLRAILLLTLVTPVLASSSKVHSVRFLESPPATAQPEVLLREDSGEATTDISALRSSQQAAATLQTENDPNAGERQLRLLGSATAAVSAVQQPSLDDPVRAFYRGLAGPAAGSEEPLPAQPAQVPAAEIQPPLPTLSPWGTSGTLPPTLPPAGVPLGVVPQGTIGRTSAGTDVKAKMGELNTAVNNVLSELTMQLEQQQRFAMEKEEMLEKEQAQVSSLTQENMQLGAEVAQLQASRVGMVEDAKSLSEDVQNRLSSWITKYESNALRQAQAPAAVPPAQR